MAYYEFLNLPAVENWQAAAVAATIDPGARDGKHNPWSEIGNAADVRVSLSMTTRPDERGWIGTGPEFAVVSIARRVRQHSAARGRSANIAVGDLLLYRVALLSASENWSVETSRVNQWPRAYLEFDTQNGVRLRADLERLVIDSWSLQATAGDQGQLTGLEETLLFRAWVVSLSNSAGNTLRVALGDSPEAVA